MTLSLKSVLDINIFLLMMIAVLQMFFANGVTTIKFIDDNKNLLIHTNITIGNQSINFSGNALDNLYQEQQLISKYKYSLQGQQEKIPFINDFIYFLFIPLFNIICGILWFRNGELKYTPQYYIKTIMNEKTLNNLMDVFKNIDDNGTLLPL